MPGTKSPSVRLRLLLAAATGVLAGTLVLVFYARVGPLAVSDWDYLWAGARVLLAGGNPYAAITVPPWPWHLNYPLTAVVLSAPFALVPLHLGRALFIGAGTALFTFVVTRHHSWTLYFVFSGAMLASWIPIQWTPFLVAGALVPSLGWLLAAKPTTGFALWVARPTLLAVAAGTALVLLCLVIQPNWVADWLNAVSGVPHRPHLLRPGGFLLLLGLLRWRRLEGRLLATLSVVPQTTSVYETLPLVLLVENRHQALGFAGLTMLANVLHHAGPQGPWPVGAEYQWVILLALAYLPALVLVLRRPNQASSVRF